MTVAGLPTSAAEAAPRGGAAHVGTPLDTGAPIEGAGDGSDPGRDGGARVGSAGGPPARLSIRRRYRSSGSDSRT